MKSGSKLPVPPSDFHYLDIDDYLIYGRKRKPSKKARKPLLQLELNFDNNVIQESCHTKMKPQ